jgi:hypothetical protein
MLLPPFPDVDYKIDSIIISYAATNDVANTTRVIFINKATGGISGDRERIVTDMAAPDNATTVFELRFAPTAYTTALIIPVSAGDLTRTLGRGNGLFVWWTTRSGEAVTDTLTVTIYGEVTGTLRITGDADYSVLDDVATFSLPPGSYVFTWLMGDPTDDTDNCLNSLPSTLTYAGIFYGVTPAGGGRFMDVLLSEL